VECAAFADLFDAGFVKAAGFLGAGLLRLGLLSSGAVAGLLLAKVVFSGGSIRLGESE
jgi:hypothetical protein